MTMIVNIDQDLCQACGVCAQICPVHIPETVETDGKKTTHISPQRIELCIACGHCAAVCPNEAIRVEGIRPLEYSPVKALETDDEQLLTLMRQRRSVRRYRNRSVPRQILDRIAEAAQCAPTGTGKSTTGLIIIDNPQTLARFSDLVYELYEKLETGMKNPIARTFIKRSAGEKRFKTLQEFVMPGMSWYIRWRREGKGDEILRDCPVLMLFHSPVNEPVGAENCLIAAVQTVFMAQVLGIGTCFNDLIPPACNRTPEMKELLGLPDDRQVYASVTMGYPKYKFKRVPPRKLAEVRYLD